MSFQLFCQLYVVQRSFASLPTALIHDVKIIICDIFQALNQQQNHEFNPLFIKQSIECLDNYVRNYCCSLQLLSSTQIRLKINQQIIFILFYVCAYSNQCTNDAFDAVYSSVIEYFFESVQLSSNDDEQVHLSHKHVLLVTFQQQNMKFLRYVHTIQPEHRNFVLTAVEFNMSMSFIQDLKDEFDVDTDISVLYHQTLQQYFNAVCLQVDQDFVPKIPYILNMLVLYLKYNQCDLFASACRHGNVDVLEWMHQKNMLKHLFTPAYEFIPMIIRTKSVIHNFFTMIFQHIDVVYFLIANNYFDIKNCMEYKLRFYEHYNSLEVCAFDHIEHSLQTHSYLRGVLFQDFKHNPTNDYRQKYRYLSACVQQQYYLLDMYKNYCRLICDDLIASDILEFIIIKKFF